MKITEKIFKKLKNFLKMTIKILKILSNYIYLSNIEVDKR